MRHHTFAPADTYPVALLMKGSAFNKQELLNNYVYPWGSQGIAADQLVAFTLDYNEVGKAPAKFIKEYLAKLLPGLDSLGTRYLYVTDAAYFKVLTAQPKAEPHHGYVLPCKIKGFEHMQVVLGINYQALIYNPELQPKLDKSLSTLSGAVLGTYTAPGTGIIHSAQYPQGVQEIAAALQSLHQYPSLTCDIEAFSLKFWEAGIGTIAFAWDQHNGLAFACDYAPVNREGEETRDLKYHGEQIPNPAVYGLLREFFSNYQGEITFHNAGYDLKPIIYNLWMKDLLDTRGLLDGLDSMTRKLHDTKIITYLATNSTAGNVLGLKPLAHEFAGNWAKEDIKDIRRIPLPELLQYNLVDALSTHYVRTKYWPVMVQDRQLDLYQGLMLSSQKLITQIELTGMPMSRKKIAEAKAQLEAIQARELDKIQNSKLIKAMNLLVQNRAMVAANAKLKVKQHPLEKFQDLTFNPNSGPQLQVLLYEQMCLPVIDYTDTKQPATGADTIEKLIHHTSEPAYKALLGALIAYGKVTKILSTFIPAFEGAISKDGSDTVWLHGNFNLGGTVSGRLSSSEPNLQNMPAGSEYGKLIKSCFVAPTDFLYVGADFNALEDRINTLLTKDPNKIKVFTQGYDSHCLRASYFFPEKLPGIVDTVTSVNSIKKLFPEIRQLAKSPAFALQYAGTWRTLVKNLGFAEDDAKRIEAGFRKLYSVSEAWVNERIAQAAKVGYADLAFGLRVRVPLLHQVNWGGAHVPREAEAEARTLGNAISGQSYGLLNNRAVVEFMQKVWASPHRFDVMPIALIHDSVYLIVRDRIESVHWVNMALPKSMSWQALPEIQHPDVKLGAEVDVHYMGWHQPITLPNNATPEEIQTLCKQGAKSYDEKLRSMSGTQAV